MSTGTAPDRNRLVVPVAVTSILVILIVGYLILKGGDDSPAAPKATASSLASGKTPATQKLTGSGDAPDAIAVTAATVARSSTGFGLAADLPTIDTGEFDTVTLVMGQDDGAVLWELRTVRDSRGNFITPELYRVQDGPDEQFACARASMRIAGTRLNVTVPLACLENPEKPLKARLEITDRNGGEEKTSNSKVLVAPK
ncbi:hypothetical protein [Aeromicrobium sp.]|uniref:hypothetical protein n=1 Tax=Aeromicrobium sp. TaxID=1871063 RepID=UPI003C691E2B